MAVTTLIGNFLGGNLAAAVSARERNDSRTISRDQAPATICNGLHRYAPDCTVNGPPSLTGLGIAEAGGSCPISDGRRSYACS
jgi:hypothetical protein